MSNAHVLVVDDHKLTCKMISRIVEDTGARVESACSANDAMDIMGDHAISLLITDYEMPDMNGVELFQKAKQSHMLIRGILCTGRFRLSNLPDLIALGFDDCIPKSMSKELLPASAMQSIKLFDRWQKRALQLRENNDAKVL